MKYNRNAKARHRLVKKIAQLNDRDFETVVFFLLGDARERETARKILRDICPAEANQI